jgi:transcriptional regulator with XRE-family HTH domain
MEDSFWRNVQRRLIELGKSETELSRETGINRTTINNGINRNTKSKASNPHVDTAVKIAQTLKTSVEYLVTGEEIIVPGLSPEAIAIARAADKLNAEGKRIILFQTEALEKIYPLGISKSTGTAS